METIDNCTLTLTCDELLTLQGAVLCDITSLQRVMKENELFRTPYYESELKRLEGILSKIKQR